MLMLMLAKNFGILETLLPLSALAILYNKEFTQPPTIYPSLGVLPSSLPPTNQKGTSYLCVPLYDRNPYEAQSPSLGFHVMWAYYKAASDKAHVSRLNLTAHRPTGLGSTMLIAAIHTLHSWFYSNSFLPEVVRSRLAPFVQLFFRA